MSPLPPLVLALSLTFLLSTPTLLPRALADTPVLPPGIPTLTLSSFINFTLPPPLTPSQTSAAIASLPYHTSSPSHTVRDHLPRFYGPPAFNLSDSSTTIAWVRGTAYYAIPGVVLALLTLLAWCGSCCYQCCRRTRGYAEESRLREVGAPVGLIACTLLACVFTAVALAYNSKVNAGLAEGGGGHPSLVATNSSIVFLPSSSGSSVTTSAQHILADLQGFFFALPVLIQNVVDEVDVVVPQVRGRVADASQLVTNLVGLEGQLLSTLNAVEGVAVSNYTCGAACGQFLSPLSDLTAQVTAVAVPVALVVQADIASIDSSIVQGQSSIDSGLQSAISQLSDVYQQTLTYQDDANTAIDDINRYNRDRHAVTIAFLILPFIGLLLVAVGLLLHSSTVLKVNVHFLFLTTLIMFLLFAIHLALLSASADGCLWVDQAEVNLDEYVDSDVASVFQACLLNTSLITAINISTPLSFAFSISIPNITDVEQLIDFDQLAGLNTTVSQLTLDAFGFNVTQVTAARLTALQQLNALTAPDAFSVSNVSLCVPSKYGQAASTVSSLQSGIESSLAVQQQLSSLLQAVQRNVSTAVVSANALRAQADSTFSSFLSIASTIAPVVNAGQAVVSAAYCGAIGVDYYDAKHAMCWQVQGGVGFIALFTLLTALALIPAIVCSHIRGRDEEDYHAGSADPPQSPVAASPAAYASVYSPSTSHNREMEPSAPPAIPMRPPALPPRPEVARSSLYPVVGPAGYGTEHPPAYSPTWDGHAPAYAPSHEAAPVYGETTAPVDRLEYTYDQQVEGRY